jgi:hypothetical protein
VDRASGCGPEGREFESRRARQPNIRRREGGAPNDPTAFGGSQNCAGITLVVLSTCEFSYTFTPRSVGKYTSATTIGVGDDNYAIQFTGCGVELAIPVECLGGVEQR